MAGVAFDPIERLATTKALAIARELIRKMRKRDEARSAAERFFASRERLLSPEAYHALRIAIHERRPPVGVSGDQPGIFRNYAESAKAVAILDSELQEKLGEELEDARSALVQVSGEFLPSYLVFGTDKVRDLLATQLDSYPKGHERFPPRNNSARKIEQSLLLYFQRIAAKNDTFSEFGPSGWGRTNEKVTSLTLKPEPGVARRDSFMERWTAHGIAAAINADPENTHPHVVVPALEPYAVRVLQDDVDKWSSGPVRDKWLRILQNFDELTSKFGAAAGELQQRQSILDDVGAQLRFIGAQSKPGDRFLYAATNPIAEECFRECHFEINETLIDEVASDCRPVDRFMAR